MHNVKHAAIGGFVVALSFAALSAITEAADTELMNFAQALPESDGPDVEQTRIVVDGPSALGYDEVKTENVDIWVRFSLRKIVNPTRSQSLDSVEIRAEGEKISPPLTAETRRYKLTFPYADPHSASVANQRNSVIETCNKRLKALSGAERSSFLKNGAEIKINGAYPVKAEGVAEWSTTSGGTFKEINHHSATHEQEIRADAVVHCLALDRPRPRTQTTTSGVNPMPGKRLPPVISVASLRAEPALKVAVGDQLCPSQLRLYGRVQAARQFSGKAVIFGAAYLSPVTQLEYTHGGNRNFTAVYPLKWDQPGRLSTGNTTSLKSQTVSLTMNVVNMADKVQAQVKESFTVRCNLLAKLNILELDDNAPPLTAKP
jgi:hypothetical protein